MTNKWDYNIHLTKKGIFNRIQDVSSKNKMEQIYPFEEDKITNVVKYIIEYEDSVIDITAIREKVPGKEHKEEIYIIGTDYEKDKSKLTKILKLLG
jgi:hypothetical protein